MRPAFEGDAGYEANKRANGIPPRTNPPPLPDEPILEDEGDPNGLDAGRPDPAHRSPYTQKPFTLLLDFNGNKVCVGFFTTPEEANWQAAVWRGRYGRPTAQGDPFSVVPSSEVIPF